MEYSLKALNSTSAVGSTSRVAIVAFGAILANFAIPVDAFAQCPANWQSGNEAMNVDGTVRAIAVMPNGDTVVGGAFTNAGGVTVNGVARWTGSSWTALGTGVSGGSPTTVYALKVMSNGDIVAAGDFTSAGDVNVNRIARWNGAVWSAVGAGMNDTVFSLAVMPNGDLIAGGRFDAVGSASAGRIARWDGSDWSGLGTGMNPSSTVFALAVMPNGALVAGGSFFSAGGTTVQNVASWNGLAWSALGQPTLNTFVTSLAVMPSGDLIVGGFFSAWNTNGVQMNKVARWNGSDWAALGAGMNSTGSVSALAVMPNGDLYAGGTFTTAGGVPASRVARWDGSSWSAVGEGASGTVYALAAIPYGVAGVGGDFATAGGEDSPYLARYAFDPSAPTITGQPQSLAACQGATVNFTVTASGTGPFSFRWRKDQVPVDTVGHPSAATAVLTADGSLTDSGGVFDCIVTNSCGTVASEAAQLWIDPSDVGVAGGVPGRDGVHDNNDFIVFIDMFFAMDADADLGSTGGVSGSDGQFDNNDFIVFIDAFFAGC